MLPVPKYAAGYSWNAKGVQYTVVKPYIVASTGKQDGYVVTCGVCGTEFRVPGKSIKKKLASKCPTCLSPQIGTLYGRWEVVGLPKMKVSKTGKKVFYTLCRCACAKKTVREVRTVELRRGKSRSCGCLIKETIKEKHYMVGNTYGRLLVLMYLNKNVSGPARYLCYCDPKLGGCGNTTEVRASALKSGHTKSCGCLHDEWVTTQRFGADNASYKGGSVDINLRLRRYRKYLVLREAVLERDNYTCQYSNESNVPLVVHHKKPLAVILREQGIKTVEDAYNCDEIWDMNNLITLARKWHDCGAVNEANSFHNVYGAFVFTKEDFEEWFMTKEYRKGAK